MRTKEVIMDGVGLRRELRRLIVQVLLLAWVIGWAVPGWAENASRWPKLEEVIVVSKTHFDIGYTDLASRVVGRYRTTMADQALRLVDESGGLPPDRQFAWTLAGWPMAQILWSDQIADRRQAGRPRPVHDRPSPVCRVCCGEPGSKLQGTP